MASPLGVTKKRANNALLAAAFVTGLQRGILAATEPCALAPAMSPARVTEIDGEGGAALVPGGVATWLQQRSARVSTPRSAPNQRSSSTKPAKQKSSRSPSTLNRLIANVEKDMTKRTTRQTALYQDIADAGNDHKKLAALGEELAALQTAIESLETQWLELTEELGN